MIDRSLVNEPGLEPEQIDREAIFDIRVELGMQVQSARDLIALPASAFLRWPWPDLDAQVGGMGPGTVSYVCAFSGSGKSTFITSAIDAWLRTGKRVFHMPLETTPEEWRTRWACHRLGVDPGDVLAGVAQQRMDWPTAQSQIDAEISTQEHPTRSNLFVDPVGAVTAEGFGEAMALASAWKADVVVVDHIDHIGDEDAEVDIGHATAVNRAALRLAKQYRLRVVATSQLNMQIAKQDSLSKFMPPQVHHVFMPTAKVQGGIQMLGLYRPVRDRLDGETAEEYTDAFRAARKGTTEPKTMWKPATMGVVTMKLRNQGPGRHEGQRCELGVEYGRVVAIAERDRYSTQVGTRGQP